MRILLIDDSTAYHEEFADLLAAGPFADATLDLAGGAREGARIMRQREHDIYFVDYRLPGESGLAVIEEARRAGVDRPIIFLTGYDDPQIDRAAERAGANDYLPKGGFSAEMLSRAIRYALRNAADVRAAREAESRFRLAQEAADIGTWDWNLRTHAMVWSPRERAMFGLDPADPAPVTMESWYRAIHPDDREAAAASVASAIADGEMFETLFRVVPPEPGAAAGMRWLAGRGMVTRDASGEAARLLGVHVDVTEHQNAMAALRASHNSAVADLYVSENRFQTYFESASDWLFDIRITPDNRFVYEAINPAALARTGLTAEAAKGLTPEELLGPELGGAITTALREVRATGAACGHEVSFEIPAGRRTFEAHYLPLRDQNGTITGVLGSARDISERRRLEETLRNAQKMEVLGQIASGVAHDFNNILQSITGSLDLVLADSGTSAQAHEFLAVGMRAAQRGANLTHHLLAYARKQMLRPRTVAVPTLIDDLKMLMAHTLGPAIALRFHLAATLPPVHVDPEQLQTALLNLAINGAQAMPNGGALAIDAREKIVDGLPFVALAVTDTGTGMAPDTLKRAVEPFFTTKGVAGTGLGLSMVQGFAAQSGGRFDIRSDVGLGTTVELLLPPAGAESAVALAAPEIKEGGGANILLVDDDPDVLTTLGAFLEKAGYRVVRAANGNEAIDVLARGMTVDVIVSDFAMPRLNGADMIAKARTLRPFLPAVLISGYAALADGKSLGDSVVLLRKPFPRRALIDTLHGLLKDAAEAPERIRALP